MKQARIKPTSIRFSPEEHAYLAALAERSGIKLARLVRACIRIALGVPSVEEANLRQFDEIARQLQRVGNNLNQVARRANSGKVTLSNSDGTALHNVIETVGELRKGLDEYRRLAQSRDLTAAIEEIGK